MPSVHQVRLREGQPRDLGQGFVEFSDQEPRWLRLAQETRNVKEQRWDGAKAFAVSWWSKQAGSKRG